MFESIKYIDPLWYYNLLSNSNGKILIPRIEKADDNNYSSYEFNEALFHAIKTGKLRLGESSSLSTKGTSIPPQSEYLFLRKFYDRKWIFYFLLMRILNGENILREIKFFIRSRGIKKQNLYENSITYKIDDFNIPLNLKVSVILPTLNRYSYLKNILVDISNQTILPFEIIIIDQSDSADLNFYSQFNNLPIKLFIDKQKGQWSARNKGLGKAEGDFILFIDDDSRVESKLIEFHLKTLFFFNADISAGVSISEDIKPSIDKTLFHCAEEFDSGNALVKKNVFNQIGKFDESFNGIRMGDSEFGIRALLAGLKSVSNPLSARSHINASIGGMRYWGSRKAFSPVSFFGPRPDPGVLYLFKKYFNKKYLLSFLIIRIFNSYIPEKTGNNNSGYLIAMLSFIIFSPFWTFQLLKSLSIIRKIEKINKK